MDYPDHKLMISALQHYAYCPRQFALIHIEQVWDENRFTMEGNLLHERVDSGINEQRGNLCYERSVLLKSETYGLTGKMDLLEIEKNDTEQFFPVEYKRGKPKTEDWDRIQLCAQALCIEEMRKTSVNEGAIWYWEVRKREPVIFDKQLRQTTISCINSAHKLYQSMQTPRPTTKVKRCKACSLFSLCEPKAFTKDKSTRYIENLFAI